MPMRPATFRPSYLPSREEARRDYDRQRRAEVDTRPLYGTARWRRVRAAQLAAEPLCRMCMERDILNDGSLHNDGSPQEDARRCYLVCDHVEPHRGDVARFWSGPFQTLCPDDHDSVKQREEAAISRQGEGVVKS